MADPSPVATLSVPTAHEQMPEANTILYSYRFLQAAEDLDVFVALGIKHPI